MAVEVKRLLTPEDMERMVECGYFEQPGKEGSYELVNGEIIWLAPAYTDQGGSCSLVSARVFPFAEQIGARIYDSNTGFRVGANLQQVRCPDVSLVTRERLGIIKRRAFGMGAPDLAVEVLSEDQYGEGYAVQKIDEYFAAGCKVIWFVELPTRRVREYLPGEPEYRIYSGDAEITLDAIAPGFKCPVSAFFYD